MPAMHPTDGPIRRFLLFLAPLATLSIAVSVGAQDIYRLNDTSDEWKLEQTPAADSAGARLARARVLLADDRPSRALNMVNRWMARNPTSELMPEAYMIKGDALVALGDEYESLYEYEYLVRKFPSSEVFPLALQREYEVAVKYAHGLYRKAFGLRIIDASDEAEELFIRIQERLPGSNLAEKCGLELAGLYFRQRRMGLAASAYAIFVERYPRSTEVPFARRRLIYANIASFKGPEFDIVGLLEAKVELQQLAAQRPAEAERIGAEALIQRINESEANKLLTTATWYLGHGDPIACEFTIRSLIRRFPTSTASLTALRQIPPILAQLPEAVLARTPDYALLRSTLLERHPTDTTTDPPIVTEDSN